MVNTQIAYFLKLVPEFCAMNIILRVVFWWLLLLLSLEFCASVSLLSQAGAFGTEFTVAREWRSSLFQVFRVNGFGCTTAG